MLVHGAIHLCAGDVQKQIEFAAAGLNVAMKDLPKALQDKLNAKLADTSGTGADAKDGGPK
eukprot:4344135-Pyramimonas_sp.AAC.1